MKTTIFTRRILVMFCVLLPLVCSCSDSIGDRNIDRLMNSPKRQLSTLMLGLNNYLSSQKTFPAMSVSSPSGEPLYSWRYPILFGYIESNLNLRPEDVPRGANWADPKMSHFAQLRVPLYCYQRARQDGRSSDTSVLAIMGSKSPFGHPPSNKADTTFPYCNNLILLLEVFNSGVNWLEPVDLVTSDNSLTLRGKPFLLNVPEEENGFHVAFGDSEVWFLSKKCTLEDLKPFLSFDTAIHSDREKLLGKFRLSDPD